MNRASVVFLLSITTAVLASGAQPQLTGEQTLSMTLPARVAPQDVVLGSTVSLRLNNGAEVRRSSDGFAVVSNVGPDTSIAPNTLLGSVWSQGAVFVGHGARIHGFIRSGQSVTIQHDAIIDGSIIQHQPIETQVFSRTARFPAGTGGTIRVIGTRSLTPGNYDTLDLLPGATVTLAPGIYTINKFLVKPGAQVIYQNAVQPVILYIADTLSYAGHFREQATGDTAANVLTGYLGRKPLQLPQPFLGTLIAPSAAVQLRATAAPHLGAFFAEAITVDNGARVVHRPFPSFLIQRVRVSNLAPCQNEPILFEVETRSLAGTADGVQPDVTIAGLSGIRRTVQFAGTGERFVTVVAREGDVAQARTLTVDVRECAQPFARVIHQASVFHPYAVQFTVVNANELEGTNRQFVWDFGDGQTETTVFPFVEHSYQSSLGAALPRLSFDAVLRLVREGQSDVVAMETVTMKNHYAETRAAGYVRPPQTSDARMVRDGKRLRATIRIRNVEPHPIVFHNQQLERHYCDPDMDPQLLGLENINLRLEGNQELTSELVLQAADFGSSTCAVSLHLRGNTEDGVEVRSSIHFETPQAGFFTAAVTDTDSLDLLNDVAARGLSADNDRISGEELDQLLNQQRIDAVPSLETINTGALADGSEVGDRCDPERDPENPGVSCQSTEEWEIAPPFIRNAMKGDVFIVAGCGPIGELLRVALPRQSYTHEGIMTRNYYSLSHSTADSRRILETIGCDTPIGFCDNMDEATLRFAWPGGVINASVDEAFNGRPITDPGGTVRTVSGFSARATFCDGDAEPNPPLVIKPPVGSDVDVRRKLHQAADFAASDTAAAHYRFFGFSEANIAFEPPDNFSGAAMTSFLAPDRTRATVSTSFIWHALKTVPDLILEGDQRLEAAPDVRGGAMPPQGSGIIDGLYLYTEAERRAGGRQVYDSTQNRVREGQEHKASGAWDWWIEGWSDQADDIASQLANCFGFDDCGDHGAQSDAYENPGEGVAVSPDDFKFWDAPHTDTETGEAVGVFGDSELLQYRSADYRRIHRLAPSSGSGSVTGHVVLATDASPVPNARVTVSALVDGSDGFGQVSFPAVAQGSYEIRAEKLVLTSDPHQDCPDDGSQPCTNLVKVAPIEVLAGVDTAVRLELEPEAAIPPPTIEVFARRVEFELSVDIFDDEFDGEVYPFRGLTGECEVSPLNRSTTVFIPPNRVPTLCADNEVTVDLQATCRLLSDNETVSVQLHTNFWESDECYADQEDSDNREITLIPCGDNCTPTSTAIHVRNEDDTELDESYANLDVTMRNVRGSLIGDLPNVLPENLRRLTFNGEVTIHDDGDATEGTDEGSFVFSSECLVDPFDREDGFSWSRCVSGEARLEVSVACRLGMDHQSVNVVFDANLFEGATCMSGDRDGTRSREFLVNPCGGSCGPTPLVFRVDNDDEGGDWADVNLQIINARR